MTATHADQRWWVITAGGVSGGWEWSVVTSVKPMQAI